MIKRLPAFGQPFVYAEKYVHMMKNSCELHEIVL